MSVAVVIPTLNRRELLARALDGVARQTYAVDEIIVVDDGSSDGTVPMLRDRYPHVVVYAQRCAGVSAARNRGIALAGSEWVAFLDSDDEWLPNKIERQVALLKSNPRYHVCHTDEIWVRNGRRVNPRKRHAKSGGRIYRKCLALCCISPSSALLHRSVLERCGTFDEALTACEDYDLWLRICSRMPVAFVPEPLVVKHGGHPDQLSRRYPAMDRFRIRALEKILAEEILDDSDRLATLSTLMAKLTILRDGARKRNNAETTNNYESKLRLFREMQKTATEALGRS